MPDLPDPFSDDALPPRLREAFAAMRSDRPAVPAEMDDAILAAARAGFARRRRVGRWIGRVGMAAAAAAALGVTIHLATSKPAPAPTARTVAHAVDGDFSGDGKLDIVDALIVARAVQGGTATAAMDVNHDGVVDDKDADTLGQRAVRVDGGGEQ